MDRDLVPVEQKITATRTRRIFMMRRSQAQIERALTPFMKDAWSDIEKSFKIISGALGYGVSDPNHVPGQEEPDQQWVAALMQKYNAWAKACPPKYKGVVLDMTVFSFSLNEIALQRGICTKTVTARFREGLNIYCIQRGWGDQIKPA